MTFVSKKTSKLNFLFKSLDYTTRRKDNMASQDFTPVNSGSQRPIVVTLRRVPAAGNPKEMDKFIR